MMFDAAYSEGDSTGHMTDGALIACVTQDARDAMMELTKAARRSQFQLLPRPNGGVLFLGDSITEGGLWNEWFPHVVAINRGIAGDTITGVTDRLDSALGSPAVISLLIGTNDLRMYQQQDRAVVGIVKEVEQLVRAIRQRAPKAALIINSVMPRSPVDLGQSIRRLNAAYRSLAEEVEGRYLDLWPNLADDTGALRAEYTYDGLHLNGSGYRAWVHQLRPLINDGIERLERASADATTRS